MVDGRRTSSFCSESAGAGAMTSSAFFSSCLISVVSAMVNELCSLWLLRDGVSDVAVIQARPGLRQLIWLPDVWRNQTHVIEVV